jgi:hypothetical protein
MTRHGVSDTVKVSDNNDAAILEPTEARMLLAVRRKSCSTLVSQQPGWLQLSRHSIRHITVSVPITSSNPTWG